MRLWLKVTDDEYQLPIYVEDTAAELAKKLNIKTRSVRSLAYKHRFIKRPTVFSIEVEEDDE